MYIVIIFFTIGIFRNYEDRQLICTIEGKKTHLINDSKVERYSVCFSIFNNITIQKTSL